jgi:iron(III) transport system ATP-binding protein
VQQGTPQDVYHKPINEYVAGLFGKYNLLSAKQAVLFGIDSKGSDVMTRPENFRIHKTGNGVKGIINKVSFWGSFYEMEVIVENAKIIMRSSSSEWRTGDKVFVNIGR